MTADAGKDAIKTIVSELSEPVDLIKTPHHGSYYANLDDLYNASAPDYCVISVGANGYRLPSAKTVSLLEQMQIQYYRTDEDGCITFTIRPDGLHISTYLTQ